MNKKLAKMVNDIIYQQYFMSQSQIKNYFDRTSMVEYIALKQIAKVENSGFYNEKVYLKDLAMNMQLSNQKLAGMIGNLRDRGFVIWTHDGDGVEGTYIKITEDGKDFLEKKEEELVKYFSKVIEEYGEDQMEKLLSMMKDLQSVMRSGMKGDSDE